MNAPIFTAADNDAGERHYSSGEITFPAVGTILRATEGRRWGLEKWQARLGPELAEQIRDESAERGRKLEAEADAYLFGHVEPEDPDNVWWASIRDYVRELDADLDERERQVVVVHDLDRYAGTLDLRGRRRSTGRKLIVDWKTKTGRDTEGRPKKPTRSKLYANLCQVAAYCDAEAWMTGERPDGEVVVALPDSAALVFPVTDDDLARWRLRVEQYYSRESEVAR